MKGRMEQRREARRAVLIAVVASLILHVVIVLCAAWFFLAKAMEPLEALPDEELTITMIEPPPAPVKPLFVDTSAPESAPPENSVFESDRNTMAASPDAASGAAPLPTQEGVEQPALNLEQQELALAKPDAAPPAPEMPPTAAVAAQAQPAPAPPEPPEEITTKPEEDGIAIADAPRERPEENTPRQPPPALPPPRPSYRPQTRATRLSGSVSNRGKTSVAALSTPLGRYRKQISDAIGSSWYYHIGSRMDMFSLGTIKVLFNIEKDGKARNPRVLSNTSNESFEIVTIESIRSAEIPPIPPDVLPILDGGRIEIDFSFSIISY